MIHAVAMLAAMLAADPTPEARTTKLAQDLQANVKTFRLEVNYHGEQDKPFYRLLVTVPAFNQFVRDPFLRIVQIDEAEARQLIDHLASAGFFARAADLHGKAKLPPLTMPGYTLKVEAGETSLREDLGWGLPLLKRLENLRQVLPKDNQKDMDVLLDRLSGWRKLWEAEAVGLSATVGRDGSRVEFSATEATTIVSITSQFGIDKATLKRQGKEWPKPLVVRLHLGGLESFRASAQGVSVEWNVASTGDHAATTTLTSGKRVTPISHDSPYFGAIRIVEGTNRGEQPVTGDRPFPLKAGYFEISLPVKLFEGNPETISLAWVDFYR